MQKRQFEDALRDCDRSLKFNPTYVKVMMRRSKANECLDKLEDALEDAKSALKAAPSFVKAATEVRRLEIAVKKKHEKMKEEVFGKLKDLGNSILGNFGMSMDNFKAVRDVRARSARISINSLFHVSITSLKLHECISYRSLIPQENHSKIKS